MGGCHHALFGVAGNRVIISLQLEETGLSDHKPVQVRITLRKKIWRQVGGRKQVRHEKLKNRKTQESFREKVREKMDTRRGEFVEKCTNWKTIA